MLGSAASLRGRAALLPAAFIAVLFPAGCGRIGVTLLPAPRNGSAVDGGANRSDSGTSNNEAGTPNDSGLPRDSGSDAGLPQDSGMACPTRCENANGTASCETGSCQTKCSTGYSDCDDDPTNGCETDITTDRARCGGCTNMCLNDHGTSACGMGLCVASCQAGYFDCDTITANGCETSISSITNCGACGTS